MLRVNNEFVDSGKTLPLVSIVWLSLAGILKRGRGKRLTVGLVFQIKMAPNPSIKLRGGHKAMCTRYCSELEAELVAESPDVHRISLLIEAIENKLRCIQDINVDVIKDLEGEDLEEESQAQNNFEWPKRSVILNAKVYLRANASSIVETENSKRNTTHSEVKLPTLSLNKFDGTFLGWSTFWSNFKSAVHERSDLPKAQKFTYLRNLLQEDALKLINNLSVDDASYDVAVKLLTDTYGSKLKGIMHQVEAILALKLQSTSGQHLIRFRADLESFIGSFKLLGYPVDGSPGFEAFFVSLILNKLPPTLKNNLMRAGGQDIIKLEKFREVLKAELDLSSHDSSCNKQYRPNDNNGQGRVKSPTASHHSKFQPSDSFQSTVGTFAVKVDNAPSQKRSKQKVQYCQFCQASGHPSYSCEIYATLSARTNRLRSMGGRCDSCLNWKHGNAPCPTTKCFYCKQGHWSALCPNRNSNSKSSSAAVANIRVVNSVALPTLVIPIEVKGRVHYLRCLLDQGAQRTLVLRSVVNEHTLPSIDKELLVLEGFESIPVERTYDIVQLQLISVAYPIILSAVVVDRLPQITISGIESVATALKMKDVQLSDTRLTSSVIQDIALLIGSDFYYKIVRTDVPPRCIDDVWLLPTKFGECITGPLPKTSDLRCSSNVVTVLRVGVEQTPWKGGMLPSEGEDLEKLWLLDNIGLVDDGHTTTDKEIMKDFLPIFNR